MLLMIDTRTTKDFSFLCEQTYDWLAPRPEDR